MSNMARTFTVGDVVAVMDELFPPEAKEDWDRVGLVVGELEAPCRRVGFAVDPCGPTVDEAVERKADLLVTHHPLYLRGTHSVAATTAKGRWATTLIRQHVALFAAHTNADVFGSTVALAELLGIELERPLDEATRIGGVGRLAEAMTLREFGELVGTVLPDVPAGILVGGDLGRTVETVAICSGAGDSLLGLAHASGADAYLTADLRHHPATDHLWNGGCALVSGTHWATEWPLLGVMERRLLDRLPGLETYVSEIPTDAWTLAVRS